MSQATKQDIESWLWHLANILRGPVHPANLGDFVLPHLFPKRLSGIWSAEAIHITNCLGFQSNHDK